MRKIILFLIATAGAFNVLAQNINPESDFVGHHNDYVKKKHHKEKKHREKVRHEEVRRERHHRREVEAPMPQYYNGEAERQPRRERVVRAPKPPKIRQPFRPDMCAWCLDINAVGGIFTQNVTSNSLSSGYTNAVNSKISSPQFNNGEAFGADAEIAYFFGHKHHFGIGAGLMYIYEQSDATIDNFHTEYRSTDKFGNTFRQEITADHQIKETWETSNLNIPILLKYKTKFSNHVGFTADAGVLINVMEKTAYKTNAAFDYEAVYQYVNSEGGITTAYDGASTPAANDLLLTKSQYLSTHTSANIQDYFNSLKNQGYNVGLGVTPNNNKGSVSYTSGSVGLLLRPAISIYLCDNATLNLGVWYLYQNFSRDASSGYRITDKTGQYSSIVNSVSSASNNSYGINVGLRYCFTKRNCMEEPKAPDTDDMNAEVPPASPENIEIPAPAPAQEQPVAEPEEPGNQVVISTPLLFDVDRTVIKRSSYPILQAAIRELKEHPEEYVVIHGYTDNTGTVDYNKALSRRRAMAVKNYLRRHGVRTSTRIKTIGHGESHPAASNHTRAGRAKNRRAVMKVKESPEKPKPIKQDSE